MWTTINVWKPPLIQFLYLVVVILVFSTDVDGMYIISYTLLQLDTKCLDSEITAPCASAEVDNSHLPSIHSPSQVLKRRAHPTTRQPSLSATVDAQTFR